MDIELTKKKALYRAIKTAGSVRKLGDALGVPQPTVAMWKQRNRVPAEYVVAIEKATGVSRKLLRPDVFDGEA